MSTDLQLEKIEDAPDACQASAACVTPTQQQACEETIRTAAYYKWEAAGRPCGDGVDFWTEAEKELKGES